MFHNFKKLANNYLLYGILGTILLVSSSLIPIAFINETPITMLPFWDNYTIGKEWEWINISTFSITYLLSVFLGLYFLLKKKRAGLAVSLFIELLMLLFILIALWMTSLDVVEGHINNFKFSYGILAAFLGILLYSFSYFTIKDR